MWYRIVKIIFFITFPQLLYGADTISLNIPTDGNMSSSLLQLIAVITVLGLAPSILMMVTSFTRIVVVLSILRSALGLQQSPPNVVMISLALFLSLFIMMPTMQKSYDLGVRPLLDSEISEVEALEKAAKPFHDFMLYHVEEKSLAAFFQIANVKVDKPKDTPFHILIPAFMLSELTKAFEIGFLIFLVIDLLVSSILMSMGMMMLPPVVISLPFKLLFFVLIDGWSTLSGSLVKGFS